MTPEVIIAAATEKLTGALPVGTPVRAKVSKRTGVVLSTRQDGADNWVRIKFDTGGHWEFHRRRVELI